MKILFYNLAHIGDTFFAYPCVKAFCEQNVGSDIYAFMLYNWYIYSEIENLKILHTENNLYNNGLSANDVPENKINNINYINYKDFFFQHMRDAYFIANDTIHVNTWIGNNKYITTLAECNTNIMFENFKTLIHHINLEYGTDFVFEIPDIRLPHLPEIDVSEFKIHKKSRKSIFYYNYNARSGQSFPLINHDNIIEFLSKMFIDYVICCALPTTCNNGNVISIQDLGYKVTPCCKNVVQSAYIAMNSDYVLSFDCGACFFYVNDIFNKIFQGKWFHIVANDETYYDIICQQLHNDRILKLNVTNETELKNHIVKQIL